jgi:hypothetical protein
MLVLSLAAAMAASPSFAAGTNLIVSGNDAKFQRVNGGGSFPPGRGEDTLSVIDAGKFPLRIVQNITVAHTLFGPPSAVAISPDGKLAIVSSPNHLDADRKPVADTFLQVVDISKSPGEIVQKLPLSAHPQGVAINGAGTLLLVAKVDGTLDVMSIAAGKVSAVKTLTLGKGRLAGVAITHDGQHALVARRDDHGVAVLNIKDGEVTDANLLLASGVAPYTVSASADGHWAVVSNVGLSGIDAPATRQAGDSDNISLVDTSSWPFKTVAYATVPASPEAAAISPDGKWIAVQSAAGSSIPPENKARREHGVTVLFQNKNGKLTQTSSVESGQVAQGLLFTRDSRHLISQFNAEQTLRSYTLEGGKLKQAGADLAMPGGPASIAATPN